MASRAARWLGTAALIAGCAAGCGSETASDGAAPPTPIPVVPVAPPPADAPTMPAPPAMTPVTPTPTGMAGGAAPAPEPEPTTPPAMEPPPVEEPPAVEPPPPAEEPPPMQPPGATPVYRIPLRIHLGSSTLAGDALAAILDEVNFIWHSQAGICFEIETVDDEQLASEGFDFWYRTSDPSGVNGMYSGPHEIFSLDDPSLGSAPNPVMHDAARTTAHELGHGLNLGHNNCGSDCYDFLMSSGRLGWQLEAAEVDTARARARTRALADTTPTACAPPNVHR